MLVSGRNHILSVDRSCKFCQPEKGQSPLDCELGSLDQSHVLQPVVREILVGRVNTQRQRARLKKAEQRPQLVVDHQGMALAAAGGSQQDRLVDQGVLVNEVEEVLEPKSGSSSKLIAR